MNTQFDPLTDDFDRAYRIAHARGMAERSRVFRSMAGAAVNAVRGLFSEPAPHRPAVHKT